MRPRSLFSRFTLTGALLSLTAIPNLSEARTWKSDNGIKIEADFLRIEGELVLLKKPDGNIVSISKSALSGSDREIIKVAQSISKTAPATAARRWRSNDGFSFDGTFERTEGESAVLRRPDGELVTIALSRLSPSDRRLIAPNSQAANANPLRRWLSTDGTGVNASFVKMDGTTVVLQKQDGSFVGIGISELSKADLDLLDLSTIPPKTASTSSDLPTKPIGEMRTWTSLDGFKMKAALVKVEGRTVILKAAANDKLISIDRSQLSKNDLKTLPGASSLFPQ